MATRSQRRSNAAGRAADGRAQNRDAAGRYTTSRTPVDTHAVAALRQQIDADTGTRSLTSDPVARRASRSDRWVTFGPFAVLPKFSRRRAGISTASVH